jgi:hypothetical protein
VSLVAHSRSREDSIDELRVDATTLRGFGSRIDGGWFGLTRPTRERSEHVALVRADTGDLLGRYAAPVGESNQPCSFDVLDGCVNVVAEQAQVGPAA